MENKSADDRCGLCDQPRDMHGDAQHEFSIEGQLIPKKPAPSESKQPISPEAKRLAGDPIANLTIRLVEVLTKRGILTGDDLAYIFGKDNDAT